MLCFSFEALAQKAYVPLEAWRGEYLQKGYGAFYTKLKLQGFKKSSRGNALTTNVFLHFHDERENRRYIVSQAIQDLPSPKQVWKMPAGNYLLYKVSLTDNVGRLRSWILSPRAKDKLTINIRHLFLSNLGLLTVQPAGNASLLLRNQAQPNSFKNPFRHDAFAGVIDAYTTKVQARLGGKALFSEAKESFSSLEQARAAFSFERQISMIYKLDVGRQRQFTTKLINTIAAQDLDLRRCYMDELDKSPGLKGNVGFQFNIDGSNGSMQKIQLRSGNLRNSRLVTCLYYTMGRMQFPVSASIPGNITFYFSYRDEQARRSP